MVHLDYRDARPIYTQITENFRAQIASGILQPGDKLPSVRELAGQLAINPNTIQRAYAELEGEGFLYSVPGKGSFAQLQADSTRARKEELMAKVRELVQELRLLNVSDEEIAAMIKEGSGQ